MQQIQEMMFLPVPSPSQFQTLLPGLFRERSVRVISPISFVCF